MWTSSWADLKKHFFSICKVILDILGDKKAKMTFKTVKTGAAEGCGCLQNPFWFLIFWETKKAKWSYKIVKAPKRKKSWSSIKKIPKKIIKVNFTSWFSFFCYFFKFQKWRVNLKNVVFFIFLWFFLNWYFPYFFQKWRDHIYFSLFL